MALNLDPPFPSYPKPDAAALACAQAIITELENQCMLARDIGDHDGVITSLRLTALANGNIAMLEALDRFGYEPQTCDGDLFDAAMLAHDWSSILWLLERVKDGRMEMDRTSKWRLTKSWYQKEPNVPEGLTAKMMFDAGIASLPELVCLEGSAQYVDEFRYDNGNVIEFVWEELDRRDAAGEDGGLGSLHGRSTICQSTCYRIDNISTLRRLWDRHERLSAQDKCLVARSLGREMAAQIDFCTDFDKERQTQCVVDLLLRCFEYNLAMTPLYSWYHDVGFFRSARIPTSQDDEGYKREIAARRTWVTEIMEDAVARASTICCHEEARKRFHVFALGKLPGNENRSPVGMLCADVMELVAKELTSAISAAIAQKARWLIGYK